MKDKRKKILAITLIAVVLLLGAAAVFVTLKLQQAQVPTAPVSQPRAAEWLGGGNCTVGFVVAGPTTTSVTQPVTPTPACRQSCSADGSVSGNLQCSTGMWRNKDCATTDTDNCTCPTATATVTVTPTPSCSLACPNQEGQVADNLKCQGGMWRNSSCPTSDNNLCQCPTATATPAPACSRACPNQEGQVADNLKCQGGMWRNKDCATTDNDACVCPTGTNAPVVTRTPAPTTPAATRAPRATRTPTPTREAAATPARLPETGILNLPGAAAFGGGLLLTILGILFAL